MGATTARPFGETVRAAWPSDPAAGLRTDEAAARLRRVGPNTLPAPPAYPLWRQLLAQLTHFFALLLWLAGGLALLADMPQLAIGVAVALVPDVARR